MNVTTSLPDFQPFWSLFRARADEIASIRSADEPVYDALLDQLQAIAPGLYLELSVGPGERELILTAEGQSKLFPVVRAAVAQAPRIEGWTILALKPRIEGMTTARWEGVAVEIDAVVFEPLDADDGELGIRMFVPGLDAGDVDAAHNALLRALDHLLGEERFALGVQFTQVLAAPEDFDPETHVPLRDLERFLDWRDKRRRNA